MTNWTDQQFGIPPRPKKARIMTEPQPERVSLTEVENEILAGTHKTLELFYDVLRPLYRDDETPLDALKRVVEDLTRFHSMVEEQRKDGEGDFGTLCRLISEARESVAMRLQRNALERERNELKVELDRLNARFAEVQAESKQPELPHEVGYAHSMLCQALQSIVGGNGRTGAQRVNSARQALEELIFNWQEQMEVKGE